MIKNQKGDVIVLVVVLGVIVLIFVLGFLLIFSSKKQSSDLLKDRETVHSNTREKQQSQQESQ